MIPKKNFSRRLDLVLTFKCFTYFHLFSPFNPFLEMEMACDSREVFTVHPAGFAGVPETADRWEFAHWKMPNQRWERGLLDPIFC